MCNHNCKELAGNMKYVIFLLQWSLSMFYCYVLFWVIRSETFLLYFGVNHFIINLLERGKYVRLKRVLITDKAKG
jgi:hypothetical protein